MKNIKKRLIGWTLGLALSLGVGIGIASNTHSEVTGVEAVSTQEVFTVFENGNNWKETGGIKARTSNKGKTINWAATKATYVGGQADSGLQIGKGKAPQTTDWFLSSNIADFGTNIVIDKVAINAFAGGSATYSIFVGDSVKTSGSLSSAYNDYLTDENLGISSGQIKIGLKASSKHIYLKTITVWTSEASSEPTVTGLTLSPSEDVTLQNGQSATFTVGIQGTNLTGNEEATLSFADTGEGLRLSAMKAKNGETVTVTAESDNAIDELVAQYGSIVSNSVTIMTEPAKVLQGIEIKGTLAKSVYEVGETFDPTGLTVSANYVDGSFMDVTKNVVWTPSIVTTDTTKVKAEYTENGVTKSAAVAISIKTVTSITVDTEPTLVYEAGDNLDLSGMVVTKHFSDGSATPCADFATEPADGAVLTTDNKTLTVSLGGVENVVLNLTVTPVIFKQYIKITNADSDLSGRYIIVYEKSETEGISFNGEDKEKNYLTVPLNNGLVVHKNKEIDKRAVTISKFNAGYSISVNGGLNATKYICGYENEKNGLLFQNDPCLIEISFQEDGSAELVSNGKYFRFNDSAQNGDRFRFYKNNATTGITGKRVSLYRLVDENASADALAFGTSFLNKTATACTDGTKDNSEALKTAWGILKTEFNALSDGAKKLVKDAVANNAGTDLEKAMARYDHIVKRYSDAHTEINDFIGRGVTASLTNQLFKANTTNNIMVISLIACTSAAAIGSFFFIRKRKEQN